MTPNDETRPTTDGYPPAVRELAKWLHTSYEDAAADAGWETQAGTSVGFDELPDENRETMLRVADRLITQRLPAGLSATTDDADDMPPLYPFPDDEILWGQARPDFDLTADSWFALGRLPESDTRVFNGHEHENPYRFAIRTPVRGSWAMYANAADCASLLALAIVGLAHDDSGMYSPQDEVSFTFSANYWEHMTGIDIERVEDGEADDG